MNQYTHKPDGTFSTDKKIILCGQEIDLKEREQELLLFLIRNQNKLINRSTLLECVWNFHSPNIKGTLENHIGILRKKLSLLKSEINIENVYGCGYRLQTNRKITINP
jgi:two-component system alkaline phosphatase synthesis response regulator PhoP